MFCINCFHGKTNVTNSRAHKKQPQIWRRRCCESCGFTFTTYENFALDELLLIADGDKSTPYNRGRLLASIIESLRPTGDDMSQAYWLVTTIEEKLITARREAGQWQKVGTETLAALTYETLVSYNTVAGYSYGAARGLVTVSQKRRRGRPSIS